MESRQPARGDGPTGFEIGVAVLIAGVAGVLGAVLFGFEVFAIALFLVPVVGHVVGPVLLAGMAGAGVWCAVRRRRSWRGFGVGLVIGWVLLAVWTSGATVGLAPLFRD